MASKRKMTAVVLITLLALFALTGDFSVMADDVLNKDGEESRETGNISYTVEKGDCLWSLADKFGVELQVLAEINGLDSDDDILAGQLLKVPAGGKTVYTVSEGDTLWGIAATYHVDLEALAGENGLEETGILPVGRLLAVPKPSEAVYRGEGYFDEYVPLFPSWPVKGQVSSVFGPRHGRPHEGLDIAALEGEPIRAIEDGTVVWSDWRGSYGNAIIINHGDGVRSLYAHASSLKVSRGERVKRGQIIGRVGNTGRSTGPHLHLELLYRGVPVNPQKHLPENMKL